MIGNASQQSPKFFRQSFAAAFSPKFLPPKFLPSVQKGEDYHTPTDMFIGAIHQSQNQRE